MMLTWHIIKKDLRRFWPVSLFLSVLVLMECYWGFLLLNPGDELDTELFNRIIGYSSILATVQLLAVVVFTAALIHEDGFAGTTNCWMTRPISNRRLLVAKSGTLVLLSCVLPPLAAVPWWLYAGWGPDQLLWGVAKMGVPVCAMVLLSAPFALVTSNLSRFFLSIFIGLLTFVLTAGSFSQSGLDHFTPGLSTSRALVAVWLLAGVSVSVIVMHLRRGLTHVAIKVLAGGTLAWITVTVSWPWVLPTWATSNQQESSLTAGVTARPHSASPLMVQKSQALWGYNLTFELTGIPRGYFITGAIEPSQRLIWMHDETAINVVAPFSTSSVIPNLRQLLAVDGDRVEAFTSVRLTSRLNIPESVRDRFRETPASYEMVGDFRLRSPELFGETQLSAGAKIAKSRHTINIVDEQGDAAGRLVHLVESKPSPQRYSLFFDLGASARASLHEGTLHHFLINRRLGRIYRSQRPQDSGAFRRCSIAHVEIIWRRLIFKGVLDTFPDDGLGTDQELTLATIGSKEVASFQRRILFPSTMLGVP